jgi:hypothetical protein
MAFTLPPPDYQLPYHSGGDASNDGKSYGIHQFSDLPRGTKFSVTAHSPTETTVRLAGSNSLHTIAHTHATRLNIAWFSKTWSEADRKRAPFYLEADPFMGPRQVPLLGTLFSISAVRVQRSPPFEIGSQMRKRTRKRIYY